MDLKPTKNPPHRNEKALNLTKYAFEFHKDSDNNKFLKNCTCLRSLDDNLVITSGDTFNVSVIVSINFIDNLVE